MPSAGKAFQRSNAQGRKFAHTRPQSIKKITAITLKQEQLSISSSGTQVASGSGLCLETWAWVEGNFECHLFCSEEFGTFQKQCRKNETK